MGRPRVTGTRPDGLAVPGDLSPDVRAEVRVLRLWEGESDWEDTGPVGEAVQVTPAGLPHLAVGPDGDVAVSFRCIRRLPLMLYFWDAVVEELGPSGWEGPRTFDDSDGPLEEVPLEWTAAGAAACWQEDGRRARSLEWTEGFGGLECLELREHYGEVVWHSVHRGGRIRFGRVPTGRPSHDGEDEPVTPPPRERILAQPGAGVRPAPVGQPPPARPWAEARERRRRYRTAAGGQDLSLYWGDLHRHSLISRCTAGDEPDLDDFYRYSWDVCEYDFWAVTDHAENTSPYQWNAIQKIADVFDVPGTFVPFYGFEWTAATGHQNVIYESLTRGAPIYSSTAERSATPASLWEFLRRHPQFPSITIPHHPGSAMVPFDWEYRDEELLRLVEIFQACRGNYEADGCFRQYSDATLKGTFVTDGLARGHRFGLIASSDHGNGASYVGAYAEELTRPSVFEALRARRTIAATTRDIVVDFRLNGCFMGGDAGRAEEANVECSASAYGDIARLEIVRNGSVVKAFEPELELPEGWLSFPLRVEWVVGERSATDWSGSLRVVGGSVLETTYWSPEIVDIGPDTVAWTAEVRNFRSQYGAQRGGIDVTVLGPPEAAIEVATRELGGATSLGGLAARSAVVLGTSTGGRLALQRGSGALRSLGTKELTVSLIEPVIEPSWFYARLILEDGEMAWSSPVWVDGGRGSSGWRARTGA